MYLGESVYVDDPPNAIVAAHIEAYLKMLDRRLSRFRPDSELSKLNNSRKPVVPASTLLRQWTGVSLDVAEFSQGLVDPTLLDSLEQAGYEKTRVDAKPAPLSQALTQAPDRSAAASSPRQLWRRVSVDEKAGVIKRDPGIRLDFGGIGKGLAADATVQKLNGLSRALIDCGGDIRAVQNQPDADNFEVGVENPITGEIATKFDLSNSGIATSGVGTRIWKTSDGYAHHLIDPSTGSPAWTGVVQVTALAPTTLEAETISKIALLSGPESARGLLRRYGGALIDENGDAECFNRDHKC